MPPRIRITREEIMETALSLLRAEGAEAINARSIAAALGCSTQPVFSNFATMEELRSAVTLAAYERYLGFLQSEVERGEYPRYKSYGMAYIRFAEEERELFKHLFMRDRTGEDTSQSPDFEESVEMIMRANGVPRERAFRMHLEMWAAVHGIGVMKATSFLSLDRELVSDMLTDIYQGIRARHLGEENK